VEEVAVQQWSQSRGPRTHVAREGILCGPRCFFGIFEWL